MGNNIRRSSRIDEPLFLKYPIPMPPPDRWTQSSSAWIGVCVGRHRVRRLMRLMGLEAIYQAPRTSTPHPTHRIYPYLLKGIEIDRPNQVWCADITYIPVQRGFLYLIAIMDWATRHVLSWRLSNTMDARFCTLTQCGAGRLRKPRNLQHGTKAASSPASTSPASSKTPACASPSDRSRPLHGQHLHRAAVAVAEIRGGLPARADRRLHGRTGHRRVDRLLQHRTAPFVPRGQTPAEADGAGQPVDMMDKPDGLPTSPQAQQQQQDVINTILRSMVRNRNTP